MKFFEFETLAMVNDEHSLLAEKTEFPSDCGKTREKRDGR